MTPGTFELATSCPVTLYALCSSYVVDGNVYYSCQDVPYCSDPDPNVCVVSHLTFNTSNCVIVDPDGDLAVSTPLASQPDATTTDGILNVAPGIPVHVIVPVSGTGINTPEDLALSTVVSLKAGFHPAQSRSINLSAIEAAGGTLNVPFDVTFDPDDAGTIQMITATVNPGNPLEEIDLSNNESSVQVRVVDDYKLQISLPDSPMMDQVPLAPGLKVIVPPSNLNGFNLIKRNVLIKCVDTNNQAAEGCKYKMELEAEGDDGGHDPIVHNAGRPLLIPTPADALHQPTPIPISGTLIRMSMPKVSGEVTVKITGTDPVGKELTGDPLIFKVMVRVQKETGVFANMIRSEGATLYWGGLFDIYKNWTTPHSTHRDGQAIDVSWKSITSREQEIFADTVEASNSLQFYDNEAPWTDANHWHLMSKQ